MQRKSNDSEKLTTSENAFSRFHIEADRTASGISVSAAGVVSIFDISNREVILKLRRGKLKITGERLLLNVYEGRTVEITGRVRSVEFI